MSQALAFGTYIPGSSPIHTMNAQVKIILACVFSIAVFFIDGWPGMLLVCAVVILLYFIAHVPVGKALRGLIPIIFILVFTVLVHMFSINIYAPEAPGAGFVGSLGLEQKWALIGSFGITLDGLLQGTFFSLRIVLLVLICSLLTFTTSMMQLTDGMLRLFGPLRRFGAPVDDISMMVSIALRFIPTTANEARTIQLAQKARGARFDEGNILVRAKAWVPVFIPLFVRLFRRADDLAEAMDARCYAGGRRTHMSESKISGADVTVFILAAIAIIALCIFL